ncbi:leucyl aminopeptidase family protein [Saccharospirillum impatiens]|uniref:leucyl aminopeptidase family protein n=1 Tax=Saccharospirillum impatiens TaxID=169438 RepID=UPI0003F76DA5|nr:leucyl aminopeptidase family protein [Saccharospirillum impatiens]
MPILSEQLQAGTTGIPLTVLESREFETWAQGRPAEQVAWLSTTGFTGKGLVLLPGEDGALAEVLLGVASLDDQWLLGDLARRLPEGDYWLQGADDFLDRAGLGWLLGTYRFDSYKSTEPVKARLLMADEQRVERLRRLAEGVALVRDLVNTPPNDMMPEHLSEAARALAERYDARFSELVGEQLLTENYPTIHAVGRASVHEPRLLDVRWGNPEHPKVTLVGKGVCFDSGGLDIKPAAGMRHMKKDMGGAAHVLGLAQMIMSLALPVNLRVLIPAVENAVSGNAFRPGDVLKTRKGLTVEIDNTDAEGRLVLCDALAEADTETPDMIIDFATLTGAARVALGTELPGYFTDADALARDLNAAGKKVSDPVWQLPLHTPYDDFLKSEVADLVNCAPTPFGGAITAGLYLKRFVEQTPWVHFDIMAWNQRALPGRPVGGEAFGVRAVFEMLEQRYR